MRDTIIITGYMKKRLEEFRDLRIKEYEHMEMFSDAEEFKEMSAADLIEKALFEIVYLKNRGL